MLIRSLAVTATLALAGLAAVLTNPATPAPAAAADPVRVMPLGDSITGSPGCWRALLWDRLQKTGYTGVDFVGTLGPQGCGIPHDGDNEGHGGILATNLAAQSQLPAWLAATRPDVVMMHLGTNDVWSNRSTASILDAFTTLVTQMRAANPAMRVLVAQIVPLNPPTCAECGARAVALNAAIPGWAAGISTAASPVTVVDQWTGFTTATDTGDGVHPNDAGIRKIADRWYPALTRVLDGTAPSPSPSSPSPSQPAVACAVTYRQVGQWPGGFQGEVTVTNRGAVPTRSWSATLEFTDGQTVSQAWGGTATQSGNRATFTNATWNGALAPNAGATVGFLASAGATNRPPTATCAVTG